jgi:putative transposase
MEMLDHHELMLRHTKLKKVLVVVTTVWLSFARAGAFALLKKKQLREWLTDQVQRLSTVMSKTTAIRLTGLSQSAFSYSLSQVKNRCGVSPLLLCRKRHPHQLSVSEVNTIRQLFIDPKMACWPALSIFHFARRNKLLLINQSTFYKYLKVLGISKMKTWKLKAKSGIRADRPNQFLHVDTTFWKLPKGQKTATVFVSDNFSRHILGHCSALSHGFKNVKAALQQTVATIRKHYPDQLRTHLIVDGGGENNALEIEDFVSSAQSPELIKWIAQKDISFSNSPVEAVNKIFKRYLRHFQPQDFLSFQRCVSNFVADYTCERPHGSLNGFTPFEAYTKGKLADTDYSKAIAIARQQRIQANRKANSTCTDCQ